MNEKSAVYCGRLQYTVHVYVILNQWLTCISTAFKCTLILLNGFFVLSFTETLDR